MGNSAKPLRKRYKPRDMTFLKPVGFEDYMTITEVSRHLSKEISWIRRLERDNRIPKAQRVKVGSLMVRLWSPTQVDEMQEIMSKIRRGRPPGA